jgi:hypothetical protein
MYSISVLTLEGNLIRFKTDKYEYKGNHIVFTDLKTGMLKSFPSQNCTIDQVME